jgi:hypothetical protein
MAPKLRILKLRSQNAQLSKNYPQNSKLDIIDKMIELENGGGEDDEILEQHKKRPIPIQMLEDHIVSDQ